MSMKFWGLALCAATCFIAWFWGMLIVPHFAQAPLTFQIGYLVPQAAVVLLPSGAVAAITLAVSKNSLAAMKTWWALAILIAAVLTVGAFQVSRLS